MPTAAQLVSGRAKLQTQVCVAPPPMPLPLHYSCFCLFSLRGFRGGKTSDLEENEFSKTPWRGQFKSPGAPLPLPEPWLCPPEGTSHCLHPVVSSPLQMPPFPGLCAGNLVICLPLASRDGMGVPQAQVLHHTDCPSPQVMPHSEAGIWAHSLPQLCPYVCVSSKNHWEQQTITSDPALILS